MTTLGQRTIDWLNFFASDNLQHQPESAPVSFHPQSGWSGASFWKWRAAAGEFLLKVWPSDGPDARQHLFRHTQLDNLRSLRLPLGLPVADQTGRTLRPWGEGLWAEVIPWFDGQPANTSPSPDLIDQAVSVVCQLHDRWSETTPSRMGPSNAIFIRLNQLRSIDLQQFLKCSSKDSQLSQNLSTGSQQKLWEICRLASLLKDEAIGLLEPFEQEKFRILTVLRDARPDQFLFTEGKLSGVIDFGAVGRDIVAVDLARLASEWFPDDFSQQLKLVNSYVKNRIIDEREFRLIRPLALSGAILGGLAWIDLHFRKRRSIGREAEFDKALDHAILRMLSFYDSRG
jgi:hypothetical protein